jgi:AraC-like DNA-binding protein
LVEVVAITSAAGSTDLPVRSRVEISDVDEMVSFLDEAYGTRLRLSRAPEPRPHAPVLTHTRFDAGTFVIDELVLPGEVTVSPDPLHRVMVVWPAHGRVEGKCDGLNGRARAGEVALLAQPDLPYDANAEDLVVTMLLLDPALVAGVATGIPEYVGRQPIRFSSFEPADAASGRLWCETVGYLKNTVIADDAAATPLVLGQAGRLLAAATLSVFPHAVTARDEPVSARPAVLRRAIEFIEANADGDIALADIAQAVHISPRAVQYMFRRHLETTPLQYLRRLRLHYAHRDLAAGDRGTDTVAGIAARWGFAHTGRFAVFYRDAYGRSPHETLRD